MTETPAVDGDRRSHDFDGFVREHWSTFMSIGVAVAGSRVDAEDLVQTALVGAYRKWSRIQPEQAIAYVRRSIVNANVSRWRAVLVLRYLCDLSDDQIADTLGISAVTVRTQASRALATLRERRTDARKDLS